MRHGIAHIIHAFQVRAWGGFLFWLLTPGDPQSPDQNPGGDLLGPGPLIVYTLGGDCDTSSSADPVTAPRTASCTPAGDVGVPEPKSLALVAAALLALIIARTRPRLKRV